MSGFIDGNNVHVLVNGRECLDPLLDRINNAQHHINMEMMLFYNDQAGIDIAESLKRKAIEGVNIRLLINFPATDWSAPFLKRLDDEVNVKNKPTSSLPLFEEMRSTGIQIINSHPISHFGTDAEIIENETLDFLASLYGINTAVLVQIKRWIMDGYYRKDTYDPNIIPIEFRERQELLDSYMSTSWATIPPFFHLDHRKIIIIDGREAFVCCLNIGREYMYDLPFDDNLDVSFWHDAMAFVEGPIVNHIQRMFAERWMLSGGDIFAPFAALEPGIDYPGDLYFPVIPPVGNMRVKVVGSGYESKEENPIRNEILEKIIESWGEQINVLTPYLCDDGIIDYLIAASNHGSDVHVIVADHHSDSITTRDAGHYRYKKMVESGIDVYEYPRNMLHLKVATIGTEWSTVGSYNLNYRSALRDLELNLFVISSDLVNEINSKITTPDKNRSIQAGQNISVPPPPPESYPLGHLNRTTYFNLPENVREYIEKRDWKTIQAENWEVT